MAWPSSPVEVTTFSPDSRMMATARRVATGDSTRGRIALRDVATARTLRQSPDQPQPISGMAFSPDSKWLLAWGSRPKSARLWDVDSLRDLRPVFESLESPVQQAEFSPDGRSVLLGCRDGKARLWDLRTDVEITSEYRPHHAYPITALAVDMARSRLVTGCHAGTVRFWDMNQGTLLNELRQNAGEIIVLAFSPDGTMLVTASHDGTARFLDAESGRQLGPALHHPGAVLCVAFHPDGRSVVTGTRDGMVQRWSVPSPPEMGTAAEIRRRVTAQTERGVSVGSGLMASAAFSPSKRPVSFSTGGASRPTVLGSAVGSGSIGSPACGNAPVISDRAIWAAVAPREPAA